MMRLSKTLALLVTLAFLFAPALVLADISFTAPAVNTKVKSCDDFATIELNNAWDMSDTGDVNNYFPGLDVKGFSNAGFTGGNFGGVTTETAASFQLFSPFACGAYPVGGRYGSDLVLDTTKYTRLTIRMFIDQADPFGFRMTWNRGCNYATDRSVTVPVATKTGWHTYTVDLNTIGLDPNGNVFPWSAGSITGLGILPTTLAGANVAIDYIRLEDPNSCGTSAITFNTAADGNNNLYSVWLDDDTNPFNGFISHLSAAASTNGNGSVNLNTLGSTPGSYKVVGLVDADYRTLEASDPWDMSNATDILLSSSIGSEALSGGAYSGVTTADDPNIFLRVGDGGFSAAKYSKLSFKITRSADRDMFILWNGGAGAQFIAAGSSVGGDRYEIDLSGNVGWTGTISSLIIRPAAGAGTAGTSFSLDFVALRSAGFVSSLDATTAAAAVQVAGGNMNINNPTSVAFIHPSQKGGEAILPWNMNNGDFQIFSNLSGDADPLFSGETNSLYLPDVRVVDGLRGDYFKGTNLNGSDDPTQFSTYLGSPTTFDASYKNLCFKLNIATAFDLGLGSVGRMLWLIDGQPSFSTSEDIVLIYDGWSGTQWYEYCVDMTKMWLDGTTTSNWSGAISNFRVDPHEFSTPVSYYFDYIKLRKDATSKGVYNIVVDHSDTDDTSSVDLYYTTAATATGGTLITTLAAGQASYAWNTAAIAPGSYLIYSVANDGTNSVTRAAKGRITITNSGISGVAPTMALETPLNG